MTDADIYTDQVATWTPTGVTIAPGATFEQWLEVFQQVTATHKMINWGIGDCLLFGENFEGFSQAIDEKFIEQHREKLWVARKISKERRRDPDILSWSLHREIASFDDEQQEYWLARAEAGKWTVKQLTYEVGLARAAKARGSGTWPKNGGPAVAPVVTPPVTAIDIDVDIDPDNDILAPPGLKIASKREPGMPEQTCPSCGSFDVRFDTGGEREQVCNDCGWSASDGQPLRSTTVLDEQIRYAREVIALLQKESEIGLLDIISGLDVALGVTVYGNPLADIPLALGLRSGGWRFSISEEDNGIWRVALKKPGMQFAFGINPDLPRAIVEAVLSAKIIELRG